MQLDFCWTEEFGDNFWALPPGKFHEEQGVYGFEADNERNLHANTPQ